MRIRLIVAHPRKEALTMKVAERFTNGAEEKGHIVDVVDLYREEFNPVLFEKDEPDFESKNNVYTETVMKEVKHIEESDALVFIFPIWWYGMPAIMKGYVDRVINYGVAYGQGKDGIVDKVRFIGLGGVDRNFYEEQEFTSAINIQLNRGISNYIGINDTETHLFLNTFAEGIDQKEIKDYYKKFLDDAYWIGNDL
ncbi:NAD(P)H oxidoreductase [Alkalihalobacillus sp. LMS6]|uniref:NAD(P)H oxidoreductase n=1 Tax=Alkalihalobacillus sp. LMS6 TaxID=2924034 RepID=UPI0020D1BE8D|nr:NAD(P)H oxidoreductase [Alkalihalobacillus sp. LMS6]UTR06087.1 NAD(P)H oxidoreductase [Alkalihalobacillus sp. LMS6]